MVMLVDAESVYKNTMHPFYELELVIGLVLVWSM